jgi:hypothetical protein
LPVGVGKASEGEEESSDRSSVLGNPFPKNVGNRVLGEPDGVLPDSSLVGAVDVLVG